MSNQAPKRPTGAQRDQTVEILGRAFADGSISQREYEERLRIAQRSMSQLELDGLTSDLPDDYRLGKKTPRRAFLKVGLAGIAAVGLLGGGYLAGQSRNDSPTRAISTSSFGDSAFEQETEPATAATPQETPTTATAQEPAATSTEAPAEPPTATPTPYPTATPTPSVPNEANAFEHIVGYEPPNFSKAIEKLGPLSMGGYDLSNAISWGKKQSYFDETVDANIEFSTGRQYDCFSAVLGLRDDSDPEETMHFSIHLDGDLYEERDIDKYSPWFAQISDLAGEVGLIRIDWKATSDFKGYGVVGDPKLFLSCPE